jgi:hypothetical protein
VGKYVTGSAVYNTVDGRKRFYERKVREREIEGERNCCYKKNHTGSGSGVGSGISDETSL